MAAIRKRKRAKPKQLAKKKTAAKKPTKATNRAAKATSPISKRVGGEWPDNEPYDRAVTLIHSDPQTALKLLKSAVKLQPERARIHVNLAWTLSNLGVHGEAKKAAHRAHELEPQDPYVAARRVHVLFAASDDAVIEAARHAMQVPDMPPEDRLDAHASICWTLMQTAPAEALRETEQLVAEWPDDAAVLAARGCALAAVCRWDEGATWLDQAIAKDPADARFPMRRDQIIQARDAAETTLQQLREKTVSRPDEASGWRELGLGLARFARLSEAIQAFERARAGADRRRGGSARRGCAHGRGDRAYERVRRRDRADRLTPEARTIRFA